MGGCGKLYLSTLPSNIRIPLIISARNPTQMAKAKKKRNLLAHKRDKVRGFRQDWIQSLEPYDWNPSVSTYLCSASSALASLLGRPSRKNGHWQLQTFSSAPQSCQCHQLRNLTEEVLLFPNIPNRVLVPRLPEQSVHCG